MASSRPADYLGIQPAGSIAAVWDEATATLSVRRVAR